MAYAGRNWDNVDPTSQFPFTFDFTRRLLDGDTISSVTWTCEVAPDPEYDGADASASTRLSNPAYTIKTATAWGSGFVAGVRYKLLASIVTTNGVHDDLYSFVRCDVAP